ncbi:MAG TPA: hypothetical protein PK076_05410 [Saprospiraceae bacterium]|nr:hypothetical protein [Saprospiraceae bacterium]HQW55540.1 hypothetical protein [Saprospiraceae bacterium]
MYRILHFLINTFKEDNPVRSRNKFILVFLLFGLWLAFFDKNRWIAQWQLQRTIIKYEEEKSRIINEMDETKLIYKDFKGDLEKFGREEYLMTKNDEDLFIIAVD